MIRYVGLTLSLALCAIPAGLESPKFVDVTAKSGIAGFRNVQGGDPNAKPHIVEVMGGGAAFLDFNNDGNLDILLVRGASLSSFRTGGDAVCALYKGDGRGHFQDVTHQAGLDAVKGWGMGVAVADYDNDGWDDILVTGYMRNFLFHNKGNGTFDDVAAAAGIQGLGLWAMGAAFGDLDGDGNLDLYIANYLDYSVLKAPKADDSCNYRGVRVFCGPRGLPGERDALYFGDGKGHFRDQTEALGIDPEKWYGLGVLIGDYDNDGWPDIFVANDLTGNLLYHNLGKGKFEQVAVTAGAALSEDGVEQGSMGVDYGDLDNDGWLDMYYTNASFQSNTLLLNNHDGSFTIITNTAGHGDTTHLYVGWGTLFSDLNNDGWEDLFVVNGHLYPEADRFQLGLQYKQRALVFMNKHDKTFKEIGLELGLAERWKSRGLAVGDYDNDGKLDVLVNNLDDAPVLLHNELTSQSHWLMVKCVGTTSNRSAVGARLTLHAGKLQMMREIKAGNSYLSSNDLRVHFGMGDEGKADWIEVKWPSGLVERVENVKADQVVTLVEGKTVATRPAKE